MHANSFRPRRPAALSAALSRWHADLDAAGGHIGIFSLAYEVEFRRADIAVAGKCLCLVQLRTVVNGVVDGGLPESLMAVFLSAWTPMPWLPSRLGSMPAALQ